MWGGAPEEEGEQQKQSPNTQLPRSSKTEEKQWPAHSRVSANPEQNTNTRARAGTSMRSYTPSCTHMIIKVLKTKDEKKTIKAARDGGKWHYLQRDNHRFSRKEVQRGKTKQWLSNQGPRETGRSRPEGGLAGNALRSLLRTGKLDMSFKCHNFLS